MENRTIAMTATSDDYYYSSRQRGIDRRTKDLVTRRCLEHVRGSTALDLGFVDDLWSGPLLARGFSVDIVDYDVSHIAEARRHFGGNSRVTIHHSRFEDFDPKWRFDTVIAGDMLRYLQDPVAFLTRVQRWIAPGGTLIVTVPNSRSLHRRIGVLMGLERHPDQLNAQDIKVGNLRNYDRYQLRQVLIDAGWSPVELRGCFLKPLSSDQMSGWTDAMLAAFLAIGDELEDYGWFLYAVCRADGTP